MPDRPRPLINAGCRHARRAADLGGWHGPAAAVDTAPEWLICARNGRRRVRTQVRIVGGGVLSAIGSRDRLTGAAGRRGRPRHLQVCSWALSACPGWLRACREPSDQVLGAETVHLPSGILVTSRRTHLAKREIGWRQEPPGRGSRRSRRVVPAGARRHRVRSGPLLRQARSTTACSHRGEARSWPGNRS